jgi:hypothetical protein
MVMNRKLEYVDLGNALTAEAFPHQIRHESKSVDSTKKEKQ